MVTTILPIMQLILAFGNICILFYGFKKFLNKPHDSLEERVNKCESDIKDVKQSLFRGDGKFQEQERALKVIIRATLALVEFEMQYCLTEHKEMSKGLEKAKEALDEFVAEK
jgi:hypothetical protein